MCIRDRTNHLPHLLSLIVNDEFYQSLSSEDQKIVDMAAENARNYARQQADERVNDRLNIITGSGTTIIELEDSMIDQLREKAQPVYCLLYTSNRRDEFWERAEQNVKNINEKTSCKATLFDLADTEALKREIEDSYLFANATGVGMKPLEGQMVIPDASFLRKDLIVTDVVYMPTETELLRVAKEVGCKTMNGLGMMLYQGAAAFELWTGKEMPIDYMKEILDIKF